MKDVLLDTIIDSLKLLPFLFICFLLLEFFEHKVNKKTKKIVEKSGKYGPFFGSILGAFPQCGFSVMATNLYAARIISLGTLISIYLSTSDEMLPIMLSENVEMSFIIKTILVKVIIGMIFGFIIDFIYRDIKEKENVHSLCEHDHCDCEDGIFKSSIIHTIKIFAFILVVNLILNLLMYYVGEEFMKKLFFKNTIFSPFLTSLIGLIPNCGASVIITELYLSNAITYGSMLSGLLTGSGLAILILFKQNNNLKENIKVTSFIYFIGVFSGILIDIIGFII